VRAAAPATRVLAIAHSAEGRCPVMHALPGDDLADASPGLPCELGPDCLQLAVMRGAAGAIRRTASPADLLDAIRVVALGNSWFGEGTADLLVNRALGSDPQAGPGVLTARDLEVAALIAGGHCNKEIAQHLGVGEPTVKKHVGRLLRHFGLQDRLQLGLFLLRHPLLLEQSQAPPAR
jgi:DNA-binding NarL/FixJ family response regulator